MATNFKDRALSLRSLLLQVQSTPLTARPPSRTGPPAPSRAFATAGYFGGHRAGLHPHRRHESPGLERGDQRRRGRAHHGRADAAGQQKRSHGAIYLRAKNPLVWLAGHGREGGGCADDGVGLYSLGSMMSWNLRTSGRILTKSSSTSSQRSSLTRNLQSLMADVIDEPVHTQAFGSHVGYQTVSVASVLRKAPGSRLCAWGKVDKKNVHVAAKTHITARSRSVNQEGTTVFSCQCSAAYCPRSFFVCNNSCGGFGYRRCLDCIDCLPLGLH